MVYLDDWFYRRLDPGTNVVKSLRGIYIEATEGVGCAGYVWIEEARCWSGLVRRRGTIAVGVKKGRRRR